MIDLRKPELRAKTCLACHLGAPGQEVDHELIAAGHPDLAFELDTFTFAQPAHYRPRDAKLRVRAWAVGQAVALGEAMRLLASHAGKGLPEFSDLDCYQCHHDLRADSWRIARGYGSRKPGSLQLNAAHFEVLRELVAVAAPDQSAAFVQLSASRDAAAIARLADTLAARFAAQDLDAQAVIRALSANILRIAEAGVNSAEQATMSLDALSAALGRKTDAVTKLYDYLEHPSTYKPTDFVALYKKAAGE
jgi:hypothetical protein